MKNKILEILYKSRGLFSFSPIEHIIPSIAADQIIALMCYREVRVALLGSGDEDFFICDERFIEWLKELLEPDYPEAIILQAIEQVKNEQK